MADTYEKDLAQKSSLTASDFIRVVGEDNVSYKQGMSSVMSAMGVTDLLGRQSAAYSGDANDLIETGQWQVGNVAGVTNIPSGANYGMICVERARIYRYQRYVQYSPFQVWERTSTNSGSTWSEWILRPTRAEIDALQQKTPYAGMLTEEVQTAGKTYTASNSLRAILYVTDSTPANCGEYILATTGAGVWYTKAVSEASNLTITTSTANKLTLKPSAGSRRIMFLVLYGTIS